MARPTNKDIYDREPELEEGTEAVVAATQAKYPAAKIIEAEVHQDDAGAVSGFEVTCGWVDADGTTYHIAEVEFDAGGILLGAEERPNVPPRKAAPLQVRKPHAKIKKRR